MGFQAVFVRKRGESKRRPTDRQPVLSCVPSLIFGEKSVRKLFYAQKVYVAFKCFTPSFHFIVCTSTTAKNIATTLQVLCVLPSCAPVCTTAAVNSARYVLRKWMIISGRAYVTSNQNPRCTQKPVSTTIFAHHIRSWLLCTHVNSKDRCEGTYRYRNAIIDYWWVAGTACLLYTSDAADE